MLNDDPKSLEPDFCALFESLPVACLVFLPDEPVFTIAAASNAFLEASGLSRQSLVGCGIVQAFPENPDSGVVNAVQTVRASLRKVLATGKADTMPVQRHDIPILTAEGPRFEERYWNVVNQPVIGKNGAVQYLLHRVEEITDRVRTELQLKTSEKRFRQIAETSAFGLAITDLNGGVSYVNPALVQLLGYTQADFPATCPPGEWAFLGDEALRELAATGRCTPFEKFLIAKNGRHIPILLGASLLEPVNVHQEAALFILDLTERKQSERDAFLVRLDDEIRSLADSASIIETGIRLLSEHLGLNRAADGNQLAADFLNAVQSRAAFPARQWLPGDLVLIQLVVNRCAETVERLQITHNLQASERRLRLAQRAGRIGAFEWFPKENRVIWTPELEALFGLAEGEFEGSFDGWTKRVVPEDMSRLTAETQECFGRRQSEYAYEFRAILPDGALCWLRGHTQFFYDEAGAFERAIGVNIDIDERKKAEDRLQHQWEVFDGALSSTPDHNYNFDLDGRLTYANRALLELWQKPLDQILGKNFFELEYPVELATLLQGQIQHVIDTGQHIKSQTGFTGADGTSKYYDYVFSPVFNANGEVEAVAGSSRDITEQTTSAELVQQDRHRWRELLLQAPAAIAVLKGPAHVYEWFNDGYLRLVSRTAKDLDGKGIQEALPELIAQGFIKVFDDVYQTGTPYFNPEAHAFLGENGAQEMYVNFVCLPTRNGDGHVDGVFVHAIDITSQVTSRQQLEESEKRYRFLAESMPQMVWTATSAGVLDYVSRQTAPLLSSGWLPGIHPDDEVRALELWADSIRDTVPYQNELRLRHGDKSDWHWFLVRALPMPTSDGRVLCWVGTCTDIHEQKQAEVALRAANRELEEFAYVASHDLQEPLRMVSVYTHLIMKGLANAADPALAHYSGVVLQCVTRMESLIHDILEFSRVAHSEEPSFEKADLTASFTEALSVLKNRIEEKGARISAPQSLPLVRGETRHLTHVFQNLLSNALKYSKSDEPPAIQISSKREGGQWIVAVTDNGIGFDQQYAARIFGLFKRLHKNEYPGTGLGLAICQRIVERYGGRMWAESQAGAGATFSFSLPCVDEE